MITRALLSGTAMLLLLFSTQAQPAPIFEIKAGKASQRTSGATTSTPLEHMDRARVDRYGNLLPAGGAFSINDVASNLTQSWAKATAVTWTIALTPIMAGGTTPKIILLVPTIGEFPAFNLVQSGSTLLFLSRDRALRVGELVADQPVHIAVVQTPSATSIYLNGQAAETAPAPGAPKTAAAGSRLQIGCGAFTEIGWVGRVHGLAASPEALSADAIRSEAATALEQAAAQDLRPALVVLAKRTGRSDTIPLDELAPYTQSLTVYAYSVVEVISGDAPEEPLYVAHWAILDSTRLPFDEKSGDEPIELHLDLFSDHPELQTEHISDGVIEDFALPLYYDTGGVSLGLDSANK